MIKKTIIREFAWISAFLALSIFVAFFTSQYVQSDVTAVSLHDTYFVFPTALITHSLGISAFLILIRYLLQRSRLA